jgi:TOMM system kinase/cyclase fusion protein
VFAFAPGDNLADLLTGEGALTPQEARHLMLEVLDALACAHAQGVVHRDLKPSNIMVIPTGARRNALVLDFGIGAMIEGMQGEGAARITGTNDTLGTPGYGAPEQWRGVEPSPRADLFSWGLVFLECLTGKPVYSGNTAAEIVYHQLGPVPVPIPAALDRHPLGEVLRRATQKDVAARDVTARGLLEALEACDLRALSRDVVLGLEEPGADARLLLSIETGEAAPDGGGAAAPQAIAGERRQLTAVGCHLRVIAATGKAPGAEDLDDALRAALGACADVGRSHRGRVAAVLGDDLLVYFGYPQAAEDDARRAARAALAMAGVVAAENERLAGRGLRIKAGTGVHTGLVVAGDLQGLPGASLVAGDTPRLAVRLAALAPPGSVAVTAASYALLRGGFELETGGEGGLTVEGLAAPIEVFRLVRERDAQTPGPTHDVAKAPLVGRQHELDMLLERWRRVRGGAGQTSLVTGEPGIGKSRLARELRDRLGNEAHAFVEGRCSPDTQNNALFPVVDLLVRALGLDQDADPAGKVARLEGQLAGHGFVPAEVMPLFLPLLSLPMDPPYAPIDVSPQRHKALTLSAIVSLLVAIADKQPLLLLVEDLHWADPTTLELLGQLVHEAPSAPMCLLLTARPEFSPSFSTTGMLQLPLGRLERGHVEAMVSELMGRKALPASVVEQVASRTDGVPLFVEELTRMMVESGVLVEGEDRYELSGSLSEVEMPGTLRALLTVRLDRMERAKETAQVAAALGREFSVEVLSAVSPLGPAAVQEDLDRLMSAGLVLRKRRMRDPVGVFKHALVRDAAYESLGRAARQRVHARIAGTLEERFPEIVRTRPDLLAQHHAAAGRKREAVGYAKSAAHQSVDRSAYVEAVQHGRAATEWLGALEDTAERDELELGLGSVMTFALLAQGSTGAAELASVAQRTLDLVDRRAGDADVAPTLWRLLLCYLHVSPEKARGIAERLLVMAERAQDVGEEAALSAILGHCLWIAARIDEARARLDRSLACYDPVLHKESAHKYGIDTKVCALCALASLTWLVGYPDQALRHAQDAVAWANEIGHHLSMSNALLALASVHQCRAEPEETAYVSAAVLKNADRYGRGQEAYHGILHAWATKDLDDARRHLSTLLASGEKLGMTYWIGVVAETEASHGEHGAALEHVDYCLRLAVEAGEVYCLSEIHRLKGSFLGACSDRCAAEACLREAIEVARRQGAKSAELRAAVTLGRFLKDVGRLGDTKEVIRALCESFMEGRDLRMMVEARRLIG